MDLTLNNLKWLICHKPNKIQIHIHKILWAFEIQADQPIPVRKPDLVLITKKEKNLSSSGFWCSSRLQGENKRKQKDKYLDLAWELKNLWNRRVKIIPIGVGVLGTVLKGLEKRLEELKISQSWYEKHASEIIIIINLSPDLVSLKLYKYSKIILIL